MEIREKQCGCESLSYNSSSKNKIKVTNNIWKNKINNAKEKITKWFTDFNLLMH